MTLLKKIALKATGEGTNPKTASNPTDKENKEDKDDKVGFLRRDFFCNINFIRTNRMSNRVVSWKLWVSSLWLLWRTQDGMADPARLMKLFSYIFQETYACYIGFLHFLNMSLRLKDLSHDLIFRVSKRSKCLNCLVAIGLGEGPMSPNEFKWASVFSVVPENVNPETCPNEYAWCVMMHHDAWFCMMASSNVFHPFRYFFSVKQLDIEVCIELDIDRREYQ